MGRSRGGLTSKIHAVVDTSGLPVRLALTTGEAHDNRLAAKLLSRLKSGSMLLADRGYDADWIRTLVRQHGAWANIPPKSNRKEALSFSPYLYALEIWSNGSSTRSSTVGEWQPATTSSRPTTSHSSNLRQSGYGCALMSPRPKLMNRPHDEFGHSAAFSPRLNSSASSRHARASLSSISRYFGSSVHLGGSCWRVHVVKLTINLPNGVYVLT